MKPEAKIRVAIRSLLRNLGWAVWDMEQNRRTRQTPGFSDLVAMGKGRILFVEVKTPRGELTEAQRLFRAEVQNNGGTFLVWRSAAEALEWLHAEGMVAGWRVGRP